MFLHYLVSDSIVPTNSPPNATKDSQNLNTGSSKNKRDITLQISIKGNYFKFSLGNIHSTYKSVQVFSKFNHKIKF